MARVGHGRAPMTMSPQEVPAVPVMGESRLPAFGGFSTRDVATLLGLTPEDVRSFVQAGLLEPRRGPRGEYRFSFQDVVLLRSARGLVDAGIPLSRVRRSLARLPEQLPRGRSITGLRITAQAGQIVVRDGAAAWEPDSGQVVLDFMVSDLAREAAPLAREAANEARRRQDELKADDWFELGLDIEATSPEEARDAYRRALVLEPGHPDAHLNLGRLLHEDGAVEEAEAHYRRALGARPDDATAAFNLGVALEDLGRLDEAARAYRAATEADPSCADAYYNLAGVCEKLHRPQEALRHLKTYRKLVRPA